MTKKQHIIPASYIGQFSSEKKAKVRESQIYYFSTKSNKVLKSKAEEICHEYLYFEFDTSFIGLENKFNAVENELGTTIEPKFKDIIDNIGKQNISFGELSSENKEILLHYMLHIYIRTENVRDGIFDNIPK